MYRKRRPPVHRPESPCLCAKMQPLLLKDKHEIANMCQPRRMGSICTFECNNLWLVARYSILVVVGDDVSMPKLRREIHTRILQPLGNDTDVSSLERQTRRMNAASANAK